MKCYWYLLKCMHMAYPNIYCNHMQHICGVITTSINCRVIILYPKPFWRFPFIYSCINVAHCSRSQDIDLFKCPRSYFNTPLRNTCLVAFAVLGQLNQDTFPITCFSIWTRSPIGCLINVQNSCIPTTMNEISHYIFVGSIWPLWRSSSKYDKQSSTT